MSERVKRTVVAIDMVAVVAMLGRIKGAVSDKDFELIETIVGALVQVHNIVSKAHATLARVRRLFGSPSEKTANLKTHAPPSPPLTPEPSVENADATRETGNAPAPVEEGQAATATPAAPGKTETKKRKGHGRIAASAYVNAEHIAVAHRSLHHGNRCPECSRGNVYSLPTTPVIRIFGEAPLTAKAWDLESLRCGVCNKVFTARPPPEAQGEKYEETAVSMLAVLHCGTGVPFYRLAQLQANLGVPVAASTQWDILKQRVPLVLPVYRELVRLGAQAELLHVDDSYMRILSLMGKRRAKLLEAGKLEAPERTGIFTTAIIAVLAAVGAIALFFTGRKHAGENLAEVLKQRAPGLPPPLLMSDALSRNVPEGNDVVEANCIAHGRRKVVDEMANFPDYCLALLERLARVYKTDNECKLKKLSDDERLRIHQRDSAPVMEELKKWMTDLLDGKHVEPNSGLGQAFRYFLKRWDNFTAFLRVPGAPLDNNICERALKMAIKLRKASLFYRSELGAHVGDVYMTLIHTAELHHQNAFDYLTELQCHHKAVAENPADWLPWNYKATLARIRAEADDGASARAAA